MNRHEPSCIVIPIRALGDAASDRDFLAIFIWPLDQRIYSTDMTFNGYRTQRIGPENPARRSGHEWPARSKLQKWSCYRYRRVMLSRAQAPQQPPCPHPPLHPLSAIWAIYRDRGVQAGCFFGALTPRWYLGPNGIGGAIARSFFYWPSPPCSVWLQRDS